MHLSLLCPTLSGWWLWAGVMKGGLTPAACPSGGAFALYRGFFTHLMKEIVSAL